MLAIQATTYTLSQTRRIGTGAANTFTDTFFVWKERKTMADKKETTAKAAAQEKTATTERTIDLTQLKAKLFDDFCERVANDTDGEFSDTILSDLLAAREFVRMVDKMGGVKP